MMMGKMKEKYEKTGGEKIRKYFDFDCFGLLYVG
jgi:hypothetical protein